jgi:hypothetical protein
VVGDVCQELVEDTGVRYGDLAVQRVESGHVQGLGG